MIRGTISVEKQMDKQTYDVWWHLHVSAASGEKLTPDETARYQAGMRELEATEELGPSFTELREARERALRLEPEYAARQTELHELEKQIAAEEERLSEPTRRLLGIRG